MRPTADVAGKLPTSPKPMSSAMIQTMLGFDPFGLPAELDDAAALAETSIESKSAALIVTREELPSRLQVKSSARCSGKVVALWAPRQELWSRRASRAAASSARKYRIDRTSSRRPHSDRRSAPR